GGLARSTSVLRTRSLRAKWSNRDCCRSARRSPAAPADSSTLSVVPGAPVSPFSPLSPGGPAGPGGTLFANISLFSFDFLDAIGSPRQSECRNQRHSHRELTHNTALDMSNLTGSEPF